MIQEASVSQVSRSASSATMQRYRPGSETKGINKLFFPLFDQLTQYVVIPSFLYFPFVIMFSLQVISTSFGLYHTNVWQEGDAMHIFMQITTFSPMEHTEENRTLTFIVFTVIVMISLVYTIVLFIVFTVLRRFYKWTLYIWRFFAEMISLVMIFPLSRFLGDLLVHIFEGEKDPKEITYLVLIAVFFAYELYLYVMTYTFINGSAYLSLSPLVAFDISIFINAGVAMSVFSILDTISAFYSDWLNYVVLAVHFIVFLLLTIDSYRRYFISDFTNIICTCTLTLTVAFDIARFITIGMKNPKPTILMMIYVIEAVLVIIIVVPLYLAITKIKRKKFSFIKDPDNPEYPTDTDRTDRLVELKIDRSEKKAEATLNFIFANHVEAYMDFLYLRFYFEHFQSIKAKIRCLKTILYFPSEFRMMNMMSNNLEKTQNIPISAKFLLYQAHKINVLRQSASSVSVNGTFHEIITKSKEASLHLRAFWNKTSCTNSELLEYYQTINNIKSRWEEMLIDYPNTSDYARLYSNFLIDCTSDFKEAIKMKYKANLLEAGKSFAHDLCFRFFVMNFKDYLKKKIVDLRGNFVLHDKKKSGSSKSSSNGNNVSSTTSSSMDMDVAMEEGIGKTLMSNVRLKLALQNATDDRKAFMSRILLSYTMIVAVIFIALAIFIFIYFDGYFDMRSNVSTRVEYNNQIRFSFFSALLNLVYAYGESIVPRQIDISKTLNKIHETEDGSVSVFPVGRDWIEGAVFFNVDARGNYTALMNALTDISDTENVYETAANYFNMDASLIYCGEGIPAPPVPTNLKTVLGQTLMQMLMMTVSPTYGTWFHSNFQSCSLWATSQLIGPTFEGVRSSLMIASTNESEASKKAITLMMIVIPVVVFVLCVIVTLIIILIYSLEIQKFTKTLIQFEPSIKKEAMKTLSKANEIDEEDEEAIAVDSIQKCNVFAIIAAVSALFITLQAVLFLMHCYVAHAANTDVADQISWLTNSRMRNTLSMETTVWAHLLILFGQDGMASNFTSLEKLMNLTSDALQNLVTATVDFDEDSELSKSAIGVDDIIDAFEMGQQCEPDRKVKSLHELYRCGSCIQQIQIFRDMIIEIQNKVMTYKGLIMHDEIPNHLLEFVCNHLCMIQIYVDNAVQDLYDRTVEGFSNSNILLLVFELILSVINVVLLIIIRLRLDQAYKTDIMLLRRVSPFAIVQNTELMDYLLNRSSSDQDAKSTGQSIFNASNDAIVCMGINGMIETINPAVTATLGYTPDQLLGQLFEEIVDPADQEKIHTQIVMMTNKQASLVYEGHITCVSDSTMTVNCSLTLIGMASNEKQVESFTAILRDETELLQQQEIAEQAKKKSEMLLYQILPRGIVTRMNQGEKDISFVVPSATIMFIDIVKFSEFASTLSPTEIMGHLSSIFESYDESLKKYPLLTKIKLIGDVYMCAGGLFNPEEQPSAHATQMTRFALDCLVNLDDVCMKSNNVLQVRIGINTGGPLIAGVLGTDKPTFDIIGDPINIASRLQSTSIACQIHISQDTYNLIMDMDGVDITCRGEVMLKGKGKTTSYTVTPKRIMGFQSQDELTLTNMFGESTDAIPKLVSQA